MSNLTSALEIGRSALRAQQIGLNVTGNNIANVNTPSGMSRKQTCTFGVRFIRIGTYVIGRRMRCAYSFEICRSRNRRS